MDPFVRRLIQRLNDDARALSRNRHFHTFESAEGRHALKTARRLKALQRDILACRGEGRPAKLTRGVDEAGRCQIELHLGSLRGRRVCLLSPPELELLCELEGVREALSG